MSDPEAQKATMIANLPEKTGKTLNQWKTLVGKSGLEKHGEIVKMLKADHGVTHGFANLISHEARGAEASPADPVAAQYAGKKAELRPILEAILKATARFGKDVEVAPKKTSVSLRRKKQFAVVIPATNSRVDLGIQLKDVPATSRLQATKGMTTHKVGLTAPGEVDRELVAWLKDAYTRAT